MRCSGAMVGFGCPGGKLNGTWDSHFLSPPVVVTVHGSRLQGDGEEKRKEKSLEPETIDSIKSLAPLRLPSARQGMSGVLSVDGPIMA